MGLHLLLYRMSSKAFRKLVKDKETKQDDNAKTVDEKSKTVEVPAQTVIIQRENKFAALFRDDNSESEEDIIPDKPDEMADKPEKNGTLKADGDQSTTEKKKKKKRKNKNKKKEDAENTQDTEETQTINVGLNKKEEKGEEELELGEYANYYEKLECPNCLEINPKLFNYNKELDRYFKGSSFVEDADISSQTLPSFHV